MSGSDAIVINTRERAASGDINDLQSLKDRTILDLVRSMTSSRTFAVGSAVVEAARNIFAGGFVVSPSGNDVAVTPGVVLQDSVTLAPAPGALDSSYRLALLKASVVVTAPAPGANTFYLLEVQMSEIVASSVIVDIFDTGTGLFVPTLSDKRTERVPAFQFIAGTSTNAPVPSGGDWVPLAIVFRPAGGGAVAAGDIIDVRDMWDSSDGKRDTFDSFLLSARGERIVTTIGRPGGAASNLVIIDAEGFLSGRRAWYGRSSGSGLDVTAAGVATPGLVLAADTWFYLYLCPWADLLPVDPNDASATGRGVLVLTDVPPSPQGGERNSAPITLPPPFSTVTAIAPTAVCVAALRRNAANTGWVTTDSMDGEASIIAPSISVLVVNPLVTPTAVALGAFVSGSAKTARLKISYVPNGAVGTIGSILVTPTGSTVAYEGFTIDEGTNGNFTFEVPLSLSTSFDLRFIGTAAPDVTVALIGHTE